MSSLMRSTRSLTASTAALRAAGRACIAVHGHAHAHRALIRGSGQLRGLAQEASSHVQAAKLEDADPSMFRLLQQEGQRQKAYLNLIASENFMSPAVLEALGSVTQNKSSEGYPGARYHSCCTHIDEIERLCQSRALELFNLSPEEWGVNVQSMSGSNANLYVYSALLSCHDRLMGLDLASGGHLSHGYRKGRKNVSMMSKYFETLPYHLDHETGLIDYAELETLAGNFRPRIIVAGTSAYSRLIDYARIGTLADKIGAYLMSDMSHISGLVSAGLIPSPFEHSDIVTCSTAKTLRGPRGGMIFYRRRPRVNGGGKTRSIGDMIDASVFPGHQSSPHNNTTAALAVALHQARSPEFVEYQKRLLLNARALADALSSLGYKLASGGTDNHLVLIDLRPAGIDGARLERVLELVGVASNRNVLSTDSSAREPSGLRIGSPAMTSRGLGPADFGTAAGFVHRAVGLTQVLSKMAREEEEVVVVEEEGGRRRLGLGADGSKKEGESSLDYFYRFVEERRRRRTDMRMEGLRREILDWVAQFDK